MDFTTCDVHWAAGFLNSEGTFSLCGLSPRISATQVDIAPLEKLISLWGGTISPKKSKTKPAHAWAFGGPHAVGLMMMLYDLVSPMKKIQIEKVIKQWKANAHTRGEQHHNSKLSDAEALVAMQRVVDGERLWRVAEDVGISHSLLSFWMSGKERSYLLGLLRSGSTMAEHATPKNCPHFRYWACQSSLMRNIHWTAGFLDGDGSFTANKLTINVLGIQKEREPLQKLQELWGGNIYTRKPVQHLEPVSVWRIGGSQAAALMMTMYPLLSPSRQQQITKTLATWKARGGKSGAEHPNVETSDADALAAMRMLRDGCSFGAVTSATGISRHVLSFWMRGRNRPYLLKQLEAEGKENKWQYNGGRRVKVVIPDEQALEAIRRVFRGESINSVARSLDVKHIVVLDWTTGKNRPDLLARLQEEQQCEGGM